MISACGNGCGPVFLRGFRSDPPGVLPLTAHSDIIRRVSVRPWAALIATLLVVACAQAARSQETAAVQPLPPVATTGELSASTAPADVIVEVRIEGNETTDVSKLPKLLTRAGQVFDPQVVEEDVRTLHRSRKFVDVHPKYVRVTDGVVVIFQVVERPMLRYVKYVGNQRVTTRTLRKKAEIDVGDSMDPYVVEEARRRIEAYYHEKGYEAEIGRAHV